VVAYWTDDGIVFHNFATGVRVAGEALTIGLLDYFSSWKRAAALAERSTIPPAVVRRAIRRLHEQTFLQRSDRPPHHREAAMETWRSWNPAAGLFHFTTKDVRFADFDASNQWVAERARTEPPPAPASTHAAGASLRLPPSRVKGSLHRALVQRRTWRRFGKGPLAKADLATLLDLTFGVRHWFDLGEASPAMLRTSPSAGARNPLECYAMVRRVRGLRPGIYHYSPTEHSLALQARKARAFGEYLPGQAWYSEASILLVLTAVFERSQWKYPFARAYRTVLLEAGHFAQTFCLVATALGLAPFCTAALADTLIERDLAIDGVTESAVYACGVGTRPPGASWAPWPDGRAVPRLVPARPARRRTR
jgi:SagB-type dehydrogenase family enzyme